MFVLTNIKLKLTYWGIFGLFENLSERNGLFGNGEWINFKIFSFYLYIFIP